VQKLVWSLIYLLFLRYFQLPKNLGKPGEKGKLIYLNPKSEIRPQPLSKGLWSPSPLMRAVAKSETNPNDQNPNQFSAKRKAQNAKLQLKAQSGNPSPTLGVK